MALKPIVDDLAEVPVTVREHYTAKDGKYHLSLDGEPVGYVKAEKLAEFRDTSTNLRKEIEPLRALVKKFEGIDPAAVAADRARLAELEGTAAQLAAKDAELAAEKAARLAAQQKADRGLLRDSLRAKLLSTGVLPAAIDIALDKAEAVFEAKDDAVVARAGNYSKAKPGEPLSVDEWIGSAIKDFPFLWKQSSGGGADPRSSLFGGGTAGVNVLRDPDARTLGKYADDIKAGRLRVEYTNS